MKRSAQDMESQPNIITFVTSNQKKLEEVKNIFSSGGKPLPFQMISRSIDLPELQGENPRVVAIEKCRLAAIEVNGAVMTEDTSLCFNALNGLPGIYIKWFLKDIGHIGLNNLLAAYTDKSAYALCIFAYCPGPGQKVVTFEGRTDGDIVTARAPGTDFFGWDPIFQPHSYSETYAEMSKELKNSISHRYRALDKLRDYLINRNSNSNSIIEKDNLS